MKKRILAVLLSVLTVVTICAGCGSSEGTDDRERRRESRKTEDEGETKEQGKNLSKRQIENDMMVLSAIATEVTEAFMHRIPLIDDGETKTIVINLGTVHETGKETTTTGVEDKILSEFWMLRGVQDFEGIKESMYSDITNIEIVLSLDFDSDIVTVQAYNSDGPCLEPVVVR